MLTDSQPHLVFRFQKSMFDSNLCMEVWGITNFILVPPMKGVAASQTNDVILFCWTVELMWGAYHLIMNFCNNEREEPHG